MGNGKDKETSGHGPKEGRPRRYPTEPLGGFAVAVIGFHAAEIEELHERAYDLIDDLPVSAINFVPQGANLSIGLLAVHMIVAETTLVHRLTAQEIPSVIESEPNYADFTPYGTPLKPFGSGASIVALGKTVFGEYTIPSLRAIDSLEIPGPIPPLPTAREVLRHLSWHWIYHSGQIGLIRLQWGSDYEWRF